MLDRRVSTLLPLLLLMSAIAAGAARARRRLSSISLAWQHQQPLLSSPRRRGLTTRLAAEETTTTTTTQQPQHVTIVGGGLAGLSTAWHLVAQGGQQRQPQPHPLTSLTLLDPRPPGQAEASSVAGGLLHPLTPKNKLIWAGTAGFTATLALLARSQVSERERLYTECTHTP